jgi:hypothetical protein
MIVKFMANKKGGSVKAIDYLLNNRTLEGTAKVLKGNEELTRAIIKTIDRKQKVTVGVLSFEEENISKEQKYQIIESFEKVLMPTMKKEEYNILWVEHTDKGRLELNFVIPKTHLETGKSIQPFYYANDWKRIDAWQTTINKEFELSNPKEASKAQTLSISHQHPHYKQLKELDRELHSLVEENRLQSRLELLNHIKNKEIEVTRVNKDFISIKLEGMSKAVRLKGDIYKEDFISIEKLKEIRAEQSKSTEKEYIRDSQDKMIQSVVYKIYQLEKDQDKRREMIKEFFDDLEKERVLQRERIYQLEHLGDQEYNTRAGNLFLALSGIDMLSLVANTAKTIRVEHDLAAQQEHNKEKYHDKEIEL